MVVLQIALGIVWRTDITIVANEIVAFGCFFLRNFFNLHVNVVVILIAVDVVIIWSDNSFDNLFFMFWSTYIIEFNNLFLWIIKHIWIFQCV